MATIDLSGLVRPQLVEATKREDTPNLAEFRLQPLERGFGHTLGNAMRRLLLSSLRGSAVWAFRIDGVVHEHQTIGGVVEDVHQIIGNLKTLTLALPDDVEQTVLRIVKSGPGAVTAADIQVSGGARVIDPTHHLFTITDERDFNVELHVNKGRGYIESDQHPADKNLSVDVEVALVGDSKEVVRRIDDPSATAHLNVGGRHGAGARLHDAEHGLLDIVRERQRERLEITDDLVHVFHDAADGLVLMHHAVDTKRPHGGPAERRQEQSAHRVTQRVSEAALERLQTEFGQIGRVLALGCFDKLRTNQP